MASALDDYWQTKDKLAAERNEEDTHLWKTWKADPTPENLSPLLGRFADDFGKTERRFKSRNVNAAAMRANLTRHALNAFETYDPTMGTNLRSHVNNRLVRVDRFNRENQNLAFIPEDKSRLIGSVDIAAGQLKDLLGRSPTNTEIADHLRAGDGFRIAPKLRDKITPKLISEVQEQRRADIMGSTFEHDPTHFAHDNHEQVVNLLQTALTGDDLTVFEFMYGKNGKPRVESTGEIARRIGKSSSQVSRIRGRIEQKYKSSL
jgi:DNA-directed RNA polymerase specialized sigma subunit